MRKLLNLIVSIVCFTPMLYAGGIVTNTNQSASYVRMLVRDASTDIDAVYFNPASLVKLDNGFHFSLNSQTIFQNKDVTDNYEYLNTIPKTFEGDVKVPVFPSVYGALKLGKLAISVGFNPIGGGGGAEFANGLPSFESQIANIVPGMQYYAYTIDTAITNNGGSDLYFRNITDYQADIYFKGSSVYYGYQAGISYAINGLLSVYGGMRYVSAKNTYTGSIKDITITSACPSLSGTYAPGDYFSSIATLVSSIACVAAFSTYLGSVFASNSADIEVDVEESGHGYTPIIGANFSLGEMVNVGLKYEFKTKLDLTQTVNDGKDGGGLFVQDSTVHSDMPAMLSLGASVKVLPKLMATAGLHYYFDKDANYGKTLDETGEQVTNDKIIDQNYFEIGLGLEYSLTEKFVISGGYLHAHTGVSADYQSDMSYSLTSNSLAAGVGYKIIPNLEVNLGALYSIYEEGEKTYTGTYGGPYTQSYYKDTYIIAIGVDFSL